MSRLRVLMSFPQPRESTNPYVIQLQETLESQLTILNFSWRTSLIGRYDVFHTHWPETLLRGASGPKRVVRRILFFLLLVRLAVGRAAVVRTLHNTSPHEGLGRTDRWLLQRLDHLTAVYVALNPTTPRGNKPQFVSLHGDYRRWFAEYPAVAPDKHGVAYVGLIREYKNVPRLIATFRALPADYQLSVSGSPQNDQLKHAVVTAAAADTRINLDLQHVSDFEVARSVTAACLVVLPYAEMNNSGAALLALSLRRPVLVPSSPATDALAAEVGEQWVIRYDGSLMASHLEHAIPKAAELASGNADPDLSHRAWHECLAPHLNAYRTALEIHHQRRALRKLR